MKNCISFQILIQLSWLVGMVVLAAYGGEIKSSLARGFSQSTLNNLWNLKDEMQANKAVPVVVKSSTFLSDFAVSKRTLFGSK